MTVKRQSLIVQRGGNMSPGLVLRVTIYYSRACVTIFESDRYKSLTCWGVMAKLWWIDGFMNVFRKLWKRYPWPFWHLYDLESEVRESQDRCMGWMAILPFLMLNTLSERE